MKIFSVDRDDVINSYFISCKSDYEFALNYVVPIMQKLNLQRKILGQKFYDRLATDIINGCIMPPLTLAFINTDIDVSTMDDKHFFKKYILDNISNGFVLDGIQRLNTLKRVSQKKDFDKKLPIFFNILICPSHDKLLYRMITLNNGQKPMSARHQIEVLLDNVYDFDCKNIMILPEKKAIGGKAKGSFKKSSFISSYLAFMSNTTDIDNKKIIEDKLDELLALKIIEEGAKENKIEYKDVINVVANLSNDIDIKKWFQNENNLIGFSVAMRNSNIFNNVKKMSINTFKNKIIFFDEAFAGAKASSVQVGSFRRRLSSDYFINLKHIEEKKMDPIEALSYLITNKID